MYTCMYVYTYVVYARYMVPSHHISKHNKPDRFVFGSQAA